MSKELCMKNPTTFTHPTTEKLEERVILLENKNAEQAVELKWYKEQFRLSQQRRFASSSEKTPADQMELPLFNEVEVNQDETVEEPDVETITYERKKQRQSRKTKIEHLHSETVEYHLPEDEQVCSCCGGDLHGMSTEVRHELKVIPAEVEVVKHVRHVYSCRECERYGTETPIETAPMPAPVYPGSLASPSAMAYIMEQKYVQALPLYRQEKQLERLGVYLSRQTLSNWMMYGAETWLAPLYHRMADYLREQDILHADETTLQVLKEADRAATSQSYIWLYRTGREGPPVILYEYQPTRASKHPQNFLKGFKGFLHVDGYAGYNNLGSGIYLSGCWAHARRKFHEALKALPSSSEISLTLSQKGLDFCNQIFKIERDLKDLDLSFDEIYKERLRRTQPILDAFSTWLQATRPKILPKSALGKAIVYCINQMDRLKTFLEDGRIEVDNNRAERSIKPFVIGRKNWIFSNTSRGAQSSAMIYSMTETAKENGLNPFRYLKYLFEVLPTMKDLTFSEIDRVLPWSKDLPDYCKVPNQSK